MEASKQAKQCPICTSSDIKIVHRDFQGYVEETTCDIYECNTCETQFILREEIDISLYDIIYSNTDTAGYDRYYKYSLEVKKQSNPLKYLSDTESTYYPVHSFLKDKKNLKILEIGSGYGYLTYAMTKAGHDALGIDIASKAVEYAKKAYGDYYQNCQLQDFNPKEKFDLIVATELIEHLVDIVDFVKKCKSLLNDGGTIIYSTPNKDFCRNTVWQSDLPPVHTVWMGKRSMELLADNLDLKVQFTSFEDYQATSERSISKMLTRFKEEKHPLPVLHKDGLPYSGTKAKSKNPFRKIVNLMLFKSPLKYLSLVSYTLKHKEHHTLGILLTKK